MNEDQPSIESICMVVIWAAWLGSIGVLAIAYFEAAQPGPLVHHTKVEHEKH